MTLDLTSTLLPFWASLNKASKLSYRAGWRRWSAWCASVGLDPTRANVPQAQAWIDSMVLEGVANSTIERNVSGVRNTLEYLAMIGLQPYEPFRGTVRPKHVERKPTPHETLTLERIARALSDTTNDPKAHGVLWACAGMGMGPIDLAATNHPNRVKRVGVNLVAIVVRDGQGELIPFPRELVVVHAEIGWPVNASNSKSAKELARRQTRKHIVTNAEAMRAWYRTQASPVERRLNYSAHPSIAVCEMLRQAVLDFRAR